MRVLILRSRADARGGASKDPYLQRFGSSFAEKVLANLRGEPGLCARCGPDCIACRNRYRRRFGPEQVTVVDLHGPLPYLLERPGRHVPRALPEHEVLLAVNVHEQVLLEVLKRCRRWGTRGVVVPLEQAEWLSGSARAQAETICRDQGLELALPKPFCAFDPPPGGVLGRFRRRFHIGKPQVRLTVRAGRIHRAFVEVSAACGATYYVARWLEGRAVGEDLAHEVVAKRMHSYPCTASMRWDEEIANTPMHVAGEAHFDILAPLAGRTRPQPQRVLSPHGRMVHKLLPASQSLRNIERAKEAILAELAAGRSVTLESLRTRAEITPAAAYSAVVILQREGRVRCEGGKIVKAQGP